MISINNGAATADFPYNDSHCCTVSPITMMQSLALQLNTSPLVSAVFDPFRGVVVTARATGANTNYPITVQTTFDATVNCNPVTDQQQFIQCFDHPSYTLTSPPTLTGGGDAPVIGFINPKYIIAGVTYAPPGAQSNVTYTNSALVGTTSSLGSSFNNQTSVSVTITSDVSSWGAMGKTSGTSSTSYSQGSSSSSSVGLSKTTTESDKTSGPANSLVGVDHDFDIIWLWLNPVLPITFTAPNSPQIITWNGYGYDPNDQPGMDVFPVFVGWLNGDIPIPSDVAQVLARTWAGGYTWGTGQGPALTGPGPGTDFATIVQADPFWQCDQSPANCPTAPDPTRFTLSDNQNIVYEQAAVGGQPVTQTYQLQYQNTSTQGQGTTSTFSQGFAFEQQFTGSAFILKLTADLKESNTLTWTNTANTTITNTTTSTALASVTGPTCTVPAGSNVCSPAYTGPAEFDVYQDNQYGTFMFFPVTSPRFNITATPASKTTVVGGSAVYTISTNALSGFSGQVALTVSGLPTGGTASLSTNSIASPGGSATLTITTGLNTPAASYQLNITGTNGTLTSTVPVTLIVQDFTLAGTPASQSAPAGGTASYTLNTAALNGSGFGGTVTLAVGAGLPTGASASFAPSTITGVGASTLIVTVPASTPAGNYPFTVIGSDGSLVHSASLTLTVTASDFSISATPTTQTVTAGGSATYTVSTSAINGFTGSVSLGTSGLPTGATASFVPASITGTGSSTLTIHTSTSTPAATYTITVTGISGSIVHSTAVLLAVNAGSTGSVTITSPTANSNQSTSVRVTASATESGTQIAQMQVWDNTTGVRLGINNGSTIDQTYTLAPGTHQIIVEDLAAGTFALLHTSSVTVTVFANGVHITAPANNASITGQVHVTGFATESGTQIAQMQVWDNTTGVRLGINNGSTIDQIYTLAPGTHQIIMEDLAAGTFAQIHTATVNITVH
jgi:hypothetical protein